MNETHLFIKIYLSFYSQKGPPTFVVSLRDKWRDIYSERGLLIVPYLFPGASGCQHLHPTLQAILSKRPLIGCVSLARLRFSALYLKLTAWFSSHGHLIVWMKHFNKIQIICKLMYLTYKWDLTGTTTSGESGLGSNGNKGVLQNPRTKVSPPDTPFFKRRKVLQLQFVYSKFYQISISVIRQYSRI